MIQDINNNKHYVAEEGKVFQRIFDGFNNIENPYIVGTNLIMGMILVDSNGNKLATPIEDKIEYYKEIDIPEEDVNEEQINEEEESND